MGDYFGNLIPVNKPPITINLTGVPVSYFRFDPYKAGTLEFWETGCPGEPSTWTAKNGMFPPEAPYAITTSWNTNICYGAVYGSWVFVNSEGLTHIFGDIGGLLTFSSYGKLLNGGLTGNYDNQVPTYDNNDTITTTTPRLTTDIKIAPFNKQINDYTYIFNYRATLQYQDGLNIIASGFRPTFASISFNIPDPTENIDIDPQIPWILCGYYNSGMISNSQNYLSKTGITSLLFLENYLKDYLFTPISGKNGSVIYGRVEFLKHPEYSKHPSFYKKETMSNIIDFFKTKLDVNDFNSYGIEYCSLENNNGNSLRVNDGWCATDYCVQPSNNIDAFARDSCDTNLTEFCQLGQNKTKYDDPNSVINVGEETKDTLENKFPNSINPICSNFMPTNYYPAYDYANATKNSTVGDSKNTLTAIQKLTNKQYYKNPDCTALGSNSNPHTQSFYSYSGQQFCPNIEICVNAVDFENFGTFSGNVTINPSNTCDKEQNTPQNTPSSKPPSKPLTKGEKIGITVAASSALLLLLAFV